MALHIRFPEIFGVTDSSLTLSYELEDDAGPASAASEVWLDGELHASIAGSDATRFVRIEGLEPAREYRVEIRAQDAVAPERDKYFPERATTLPAPGAEQVASLGTLNDLHFGEMSVGGVLTDDYEYGEEAPGFPKFHADDGEVPYWSFMNADAIAEINSAQVDAAIIKGDIADRGRPEQFAAAADAFSKFSMPHHAVLGNHDHYARLEGEEVDGYALLDQPACPRGIDLGGWRVLLLETALPGEHHGVIDERRRDWLAEELDATRRTHTPTLLFMHHQPVAPQFADRYPNTIGVLPDDSMATFDLFAGNPQLRGVLIGHTHRNRVRRYPETGTLPFVEVHSSKDFPGGWAHYRLFADGSFHQEARRTSSQRALEHSARCRALFRGFYRDFALGTLDARSFAVGASR